MRRLYGVSIIAAMMALSPIVVHAQTISAIWDPNPPADQLTGYQVCIGTSSMTCNVQQASVPPTDTSYTFTPSAGVLYRVAVRGVSAAGVGNYSAEVLASIPALTQPANQLNRANTAITPLTLTASDPDGGVVRYSHTGLPIGLTLNQTTGVISGTPTAMGSYNVTVYANDGLAATSRSFTWTIASWPSSVTLTSNLASPRTTGTSITFTAAATGGTAPYQFKWWVSNGSTWTMVQDWGSATYTWTPTVANANYQVGVWARDSTTTADVNNVNISVPYVITGASMAPVTITSLTSNLSSPRTMGTPITFTATASGGTGSYQFKWWLYNGTTWTMVRDWGTASYTWTPTAANPNYRVGIWARDATTTADVSNVTLSVPYVITGTSSLLAPVTITGLTSDVWSPRLVGTPITFTATASGGTGSYQFKWWLYNGTTWTMVRDWGTASYTWTPNASNPNYRVGIWARDATTTANVDNVNLSVPFAITATAPLTITGLTSNLSSPRAAGTSITFTATASGGTGPYQFMWWVYNGTTWTMVRNWGSATYTWTPTAANANYRVGVWARDATTTADVGIVNRSIAFSIVP